MQLLFATIPRRDGHFFAWAAITPTFIIAILTLMAAIALFLMNGPFQPLDLGGLTQRIYWLISLLWLFLVALGLRSLVASSLADETYAGEVSHTI